MLTEVKKKELSEKFEKDGLEKVHEDLATGVYAGEKKSFAENWCSEQEKKSENQRSSETLEIAKEANKISKESNDLAKKANSYSFWAVILSGIAIIVSLIAYIK